MLNDVEFLINKTICPVDDEELLILIIQHSSFKGQLKIARMLLAAGAPCEKAKLIANQKFENLWDLISKFN